MTSENYMYRTSGIKNYDIKDKHDNIRDKDYDVRDKDYDVRDKNYDIRIKNGSAYILLKVVSSASSTFRDVLHHVAPPPPQLRPVVSRLQAVC